MILHFFSSDAVWVCNFCDYKTQRGQSEHIFAYYQRNSQKNQWNSFRFCLIRNNIRVFSSVNRCFPCIYYEIGWWVLRWRSFLCIVFRLQTQNFAFEQWSRVVAHKKRQLGRIGGEKGEGKGVNKTRLFPPSIRCQPDCIFWKQLPEGFPICFFARCFTFRFSKVFLKGVFFCIC